MSERTNVSVPDDAFHALKAHKRDGESWGEVFERAAAALHGTESPDNGDDARHSEGAEASAMQSIPDDVLTEAHIDDIAERAGQRAADAVESRLR